MADARSLTFGIFYKTGDSISKLEDVHDRLNDIGEASSRVEQDAASAGEAFRNMGAEGSSSFRQMGADASSFGSAFRQTMSAGLKQGESVTKSIRSGFSGALGYAEKQLTSFRNKTRSSATAIANAFQHPIQTIRNRLIDALDQADAATGDVGNRSDETGRRLDDMGSEGQQAGDKIKDAIKGALGAFLGIEAIKQGIELLKQFGTAAVDAAKEAETSTAKFENMFGGTDVEAWADNFADSIHRSDTEVQNFLVSSNAMYTQLGMTDEAASTLAKTTTSLAYDLGNAFSMDDSEALSALQSAIGGSADALAEYGVRLDDATLKQKALDMGLGDDLDSLDEATKAQLRLSAILDQTSNAQMGAITQTNSLTNSTKSLNGVWSNFMADAGAKFSPALQGLFDSITGSWPEIEPALMGMVDMLSEGLGDAIPVVMELGENLFPVLTDVLGTVFEAVTPLLDVFASLAGTVLPPLTDILGTLVGSLLPPIADILGTVFSIVQPLLPPLQTIADAVLPAIGSLLDIISPLLQTISPVLETIGSVLGTIADVLGTVVGWLADGVGAVVNFFSGLFGGAKDSREEIEGLSDAVSGLDEATSEASPSIGVDTSEYTAGMRDAAVEASGAAQDSIIETKDITDVNLKAMGVEASSTYTTMAIDAETAWDRMTSAADAGADKIVAAFQRIGSAALTVNGADISITGVANIPGNADGTSSFEGGWTRINEEGGELAFLPGGTAIVPADRSEQLIDGMTSQTNSTFAPSVVIQIDGNADSETAAEIEQRLEALFSRWYERKRREEDELMAIKRGYT